MVMSPFNPSGKEAARKSWRENTSVSGMTGQHDFAHRAEGKTSTPTLLNRTAVSELL